MAYISAVEVKAIREMLKETFPQFKFGVRKSPGGGHSVGVTIKSGPTDFSDCFTHGDGYAQINQYWTQNYGEHKGFFDKVFEIIKTAPAVKGVGRAWYDNSDAMTDYFDTAYYMHLNVGDWNQPYVQK
jgi:hypothetical protein